MNAFETHGITHLSASSLNLYVAEPALWVMERLLGKRAPVGVRAHGGSAVESGVTEGLLKPKISFYECQETALQHFRQLTAFSTDARLEQEREAIPEMVAVALAELRQYGVPTEVQRKIEITLDGVPVPFKGYIDMSFGQHKVDVDLKTTLRMPSKIGASHARQGANYAKATGHEQRFAYTTPKKIAVYILQDVNERLTEIANVAQRMEKFLGQSKDAEELAGMLVPDPDSYFWNNPTAQALRKEAEAGISSRASNTTRGPGGSSGSTGSKPIPANGPMTRMSWSCRFGSLSTWPMSRLAGSRSTAPASTFRWCGSARTSRPNPATSTSAGSDASFTARISGFAPGTARRNA